MKVIKIALIWVFMVFVFSLLIWGGTWLLSLVFNNFQVFTALQSLVVGFLFSVFYNVLTLRKQLNIK